MAWARRNAFNAAFVVVLLTVVVVIATFSDTRVRRRVQALAWKVSGSLPYVSWRELFKTLLPGRWISTPPPPGYFVREKGSGEDPCPVLWETQQGAFWGQRNDDITLQDPQRHLERYQNGPVTVRSGDVVIDCGSQIGTFTRFALAQGAGRVVAIEPEPTNNTCFKRTFAKEIAEGRVVLVEAALGERSGNTKFAVASRGDAGVVASEFDPHWPWKTVRVIDVPTTTLDDTVQRLNLPRVDFIKWGFGGIRLAIRGARQTLSRFRPRMAMIIAISPDDPVVLPRLVLEAVPTYNVFTWELQVAYFY